MTTPTYMTTRKRGFSLIEMLVVLAITTILLGLILVPLATTFNFTNRARKTVEVQDSARYAMELTSREVADAMQAVVNPGDYFPYTFYDGGKPGSGNAFEVHGVGYINAYDDVNNVDNGRTAWPVASAMIDLVLPHDDLGLEGGTVRSPLVPQYQTADDGTEHPIIVRYFVGLAQPKATNAGYPVWRNNNVLRGGASAENMYTIYRVEFDPYDPHFARWAIPDPNAGPTPDGKAVYMVNPNFFYDMNSVDGEPAAYWWRKAAVAIMPADRMDLVDFVRADTTKAHSTSNPYTEARSLVTFTPLIVPSDTASPVGASKQPTTYKTQYGHWTGVQNDGTYAFTDFTPALGAGMVPHITVYNQQRDPDTGATTLTPVFDTVPNSSYPDADPAKKTRALSWNSLKGTVEFSLPFAEFSTTADGATTEYNPLHSPDSLPAPGAYITPRTALVQVEEPDPADTSANPAKRLVTYSQAQGGEVLEVPESIALQTGQPQQLPPPRTYIITPDNQIIVGYPYPSVNNPLASQPIPSGQKIVINGFYQNNNPNDVVKVDYLTRELISITMTAREYDYVDRSSLTTTISNRVRLRNIQR